MIAPGQSAGAAPNVYRAAAEAMAALAVSFQVHNAALLTHLAATDELWPAQPEVVARQGRIHAYGAWLMHMAGECERQSAAYLMADRHDRALPLHVIPAVLGRAVGLAAMNVRAYLEIAIMLQWPPTSAQLSVVEALRITSMPLLPPPPLLVDELPSAGEPGGAL